jgi:hypothetical protein
LEIDTVTGNMFQIRDPRDRVSKGLRTRGRARGQFTACEFVRGRAVSGP